MSTNNTRHGGDDGESGLLDGSRLPKDDLVFAALGDIDELSSVIGLAKASLRVQAKGAETETQLLESIQTDLLRIGAQVAMPESDRRYDSLDLITRDDVATLDKLIGSYADKVVLPKKFILPGGTITGAQVDVSRAVCRRAERRIVACISEKNMEQLADCQRYLNRLSGLLFILARWLEAASIKE